MLIFLLLLDIQTLNVPNEVNRDFPVAEITETASTGCAANPTAGRQTVITEPPQAILTITGLMLLFLLFGLRRRSSF